MSKILASVSDAEEREALAAFVGTTFEGRYRIDALLGMGGMGGVFRAHHLALGRDVALKVLRPGVRTGQIASARFQREGRSASRLDHPSCVRVDDFGELADGTKFLVMELLVGDELRSRLGAPWDPAEAIAVTLQLLEGLAHAHARGIVHRDLKPENVLLTADDDGARRVKIVDFGIAKIIEGDDGDPKLTRAGMLFGTPRYMSPEQAGGGKIDARTDLYATGLLLYEMLAGQPPFDAPDAAAVMRMHVLVPPPPLPDTVPAPLAAVVMRMLAKARVDRYADAREAIVALERARTELSPTRPPPPALEVRPPPAPSVAPAQPHIASMPPFVPSWPQPQPRARTGVTRRQLVVVAVVLVLFWIVVLAAVLRPSSTPSSAPSATPPVATPSLPAAPAARVDPPPVLLATAHACRGDACECEGHDDCELACTGECELECGGKRVCSFACGADCKVECEGHSECTVEVGDGSKVECGGGSRCEVGCRGECRLECHGKARCSLRCLDGSAPLDCGKDEHACGRCR